MKTSVVSLANYSARRLAHSNQNASPQPTGFPELDAHLPGGGWPRGGLIEIFASQEAMGKLSLLRSALVAFSRQRRWLAWVAAPTVPHGSALSAWGINPAAVLVVHAKRGMDMLKVTERGLVSGMCSAVLVWSPQATWRQLRRLQLAAQKSDASIFLFRPIDTVADPSPAQLRLSITREHRLLTITLLKGWQDDARKGYDSNCLNPTLRLNIDHTMDRNSVA